MSEEIESLRAEVAALRAEVANLRAKAGSSPAPLAFDEPVDRRAALRRAGALAAGAVAGGAALVGASATPAAAATLTGSGNPGVSATGVGGHGLVATTTSADQSGVHVDVGVDESVGIDVHVNSNGAGIVVQNDGPTTLPLLSLHGNTPNAKALWVLGNSPAVIQNLGGPAHALEVFASGNTSGVHISAEGASPHHGLFVEGGVNTAARFSTDRRHLILMPSDLIDPPPTDSDTHEAGEITMTVNQELWVCVAGGDTGSDSTFRKLAGPSTAGSFHVLPATKRVYDSRVGQPPTTVTKGTLAAGATRNVDCRLGSAVPAGATAVLVNLTAVHTTGSSGYLSLFAAGTPWQGNSSLNWSSPGQVVANTTTVAVRATDATFTVRASAKTHFLVDVIGYYR